MKQNNTWTKKERLLDRASFDAVFEQHQKVVRPHYVLYWKKSSTAKLGIVASKKFGNAVVRNRFKRCVREAFRTSKSRVGDYEFVVIARKMAAKPSQSQVFTSRLINSMETVSREQAPCQS